MHHFLRCLKEDEVEIWHRKTGMESCSLCAVLGTLWRRSRVRVAFLPTGRLLRLSCMSTSFGLAWALWGWFRESWSYKHLQIVFVDFGYRTDLGYKSICHHNTGKQRGCAVQARFWDSCSFPKSESFSWSLLDHWLLFHPSGRWQLHLYLTLK